MMCGQTGQNGLRALQSVEEAIKPEFALVKVALKIVRVPPRCLARATCTVAKVLFYPCSFFNQIKFINKGIGNNIQPMEYYYHVALLQINNLIQLKFHIILYYYF